MMKKSFLSVSVILAVQLISLSQFTSCSKEDALIDTGTGPDGLGKIQGSNATTILGINKLGREYFWFSGLPYAKPESYMGENRFKIPEDWSGVLPDDTNNGEGIFYADIRKAAIICPQKAVLSLSSSGSSVSNSSGEPFTGHYPLDLMKAYYNRDGVEKRRIDVADEDLWGQENCLTLTVSTPKLPKGNDDVKLPVMVFIHGGGFDQYWGGIFGGQRLLNHDMVYVSINYRLGFLGSLNLGIEEAPGNGMLYDCISSLRWVQRYIHHFGGDKERVTVSGQSAGAVLSTAVLVSPITKSENLIHGAIGASGSVLSVWASQANPIEENLKLIRFIPACSGLIPGGGRLPNDTEALELRDCVGNQTPAELLNARDRYGAVEHFEGRMGYDALVPSLQNAELGLKIDLVLPRTPAEIVKRQEQCDVPILMGTTRHDGSFVMIDTLYDYLIANGRDSDSAFIKNDLFPAFLKGVGITDPSNAMIHSLQKTYLGDAANSDDILSKAAGLLDLHTVIGFKAGGYGLVEAHSKLNSNSYWYAFEYQGRFTTFEIGFGINLVRGGIAHVDDLLYLFQMIPLTTNEDFAVSHRYVEYWANFVIYGNPNGPEGDLPFPKCNVEDHRFLKINGTDRVGYHVRDTWQRNSDELEWIF